MKYEYTPDSACRVYYITNMRDGLVHVHDHRDWLHYTKCFQYCAMGGWYRVDGEAPTCLTCIGVRLNR